jgi:hypothetical protein
LQTHINTTCAESSAQAFGLIDEKRLGTKSRTPCAALPAQPL